MSLNNQIVDGEARLRIYSASPEHGEAGAVQLAKLTRALVDASPYVIGVTVRWGGLHDVEVAIPRDGSLDLGALRVQLQARADACSSARARPPG